MCGRFGINQQQQELEANFNASFYSDEVRKRYDPNYDVRPSTDVPVITSAIPKAGKTLPTCKMIIVIHARKVIFLG